MFYVLDRPARGAARARTFRAARRAQPRLAARSGRARHRRRRRPPRSRQPHTRRQRIAAHSRRPHAARDFARCSPSPVATRPRHDLRPRIRRRTAAQRGRAHGGHVRRHRVPACRRRCDRRRGSRGELDRLNRERRAVEATMQEQALEAIDTIVAGDAFTLCALPCRLAPGRRRTRRVPAQGSLPSSGDRVRARRRR